MTTRKAWTRDQLLVAFRLYCQIPFGRLHSRNPEIIEYAGRIDRTPSALAMKLSNIASLDPAITNTGRIGLKGASSSDRAMWDAMQSDWETFVADSEKAISALPEASTNHFQPDEPVDYSGSTKLTNVKTRVGQHFFRKAVLSAYDSQCCITGLSLPNLLIASHIVPWKDDESNRLNPSNGLALSMLHDKAFDSGMLTIDDEMKVVVSTKYLSHSVDEFFKYSIQRFHGKKISLPEKFEPKQSFLEYHREHIFEKGVILK